jgi:hypothetical protein
MREDITPEEKLLRLIKGKKPAGQKPMDQKPGGQKPVGLPLGTSSQHADSKGRSTMKRPVLDAANLKRYLIGNVTKVLVFLSISVIIYFLLDSFVITPYYRQKISRIDVKPESVQQTREATNETPDAIEGKAPAATGEPAKPYSYYSKDISSRNIFRAPAQKEAEVIEDEFKKARERFSLIGIITGAQLQAAIEDKASKRTYFVYKGEQIEDVVVDDVLDNKVILDYKGQTFDLML